MDVDGKLHRESNGELMKKTLLIITMLSGAAFGATLPDITATPATFPNGLNINGPYGNSNYLQIGTATTNDTLANMILSTVSSGNKALVLQGSASQSVDLMQIQTSTGVVYSAFPYISGTLTGTQNTLLGSGGNGSALTSGFNNCFIGYDTGAATIGGAYNTYIGTAAGNNGITAKGCTALGDAANITNGMIGGISIGIGSTATANGQFVAGSTFSVNGTNGNITNVFFGNGVTAATPVACTINGSGGSGVNIAGANLLLAGGIGTGTGTGGSLLLQVAPFGLSGSSANTLSTVATFADGSSGTTITATTAVAAAASTAGNPVAITATNAVAGTSSNGAAAGGTITLTSGNAARLVSGNANAGDIALNVGTGIGTGRAGQVIINGTSTVFSSTGALTLATPLASTSGGTGVNNAGTFTNASNTTITGGGTISLGGFTCTIPATDTVAMLGQSNTFTGATQTINNASAALSIQTGGTAYLSITQDASNGYIQLGSSTKRGNFQLYNAGGSIGVQITGNNFCGFNNATVMSWDANNSITGSADIGITRNGIGILEIDNGTAGTMRDLKLRNLIAGIPGSLTGQVQLGNATGANTTILQAGASAPQLTYTFPTAAPSAGQFLQSTDVNATLAWATPAAGVSTATVPLRISGANIDITTQNTSATPGNYTIYGISGSGSNIAGANQTFAGGAGTGTGTGGSVIIQVATAGASSGSSLNAEAAVATFADGSSGTTITATTPVAPTNAATAGNPLALTATNATASAGTAGAAAGGTVTITSGNAAQRTSGNANGGNVLLTLGTGVGTGSNGQVYFGNGATNASPQAAILNATGGNGTNINGANLTLGGGIGTGTGTGGSVLIQVATAGGASGSGANTLASVGTFADGATGTTITATTPSAAASTTAGNPVAITATNATAGTSNAGAAAGGSLTLTAGNAARLTSGNAAGGDVIASLSTGIGTGRRGHFRVGPAATTDDTLADTLLSQTATGQRILTLQQLASPTVDAMQVQGSTGAIYFGIPYLGGVLTGTNNLLVGYGNSGKNLTSGASNTICGAGSATGASFNSSNVTIVGAGSATNASFNPTDAVIVGQGSGTGVTNPGAGLVIVGRNSGNSISSNGGNTIIGSGTAGSLTSGGNVVIGDAAATGVSSGSNNVIIGSGTGNSAAGTNVVIGQGANVGSAANVVIGQAAGSGSITGQQNVIIGQGTGTVLTTGQKNIFIGVGTQGEATGTSNTASIGGATSAITSIYWGTGVTNAAPSATITMQPTPVSTATTNGAGTDFIYGAGGGTGTGRGGAIKLRTAPSVASGTTQGTLTDRYLVQAKGLALTSGTPATLSTLSLASGSNGGGVIHATILCTDGTDFQAFTQTVEFAMVNKAGTFTTNISADTGSKAVSAGTLTTSWTVTAAGAIQVSATTSLTATTFVCYYTITNNGTTNETLP